MKKNNTETENTENTEIDNVEIETSELTNSDAKRKTQITHETTVCIFDIFRVIVSSDEHTMLVQKKKCYDDNSENWVDWGYFGYWDALLKSIHNATVKEKISKKTNATILDVLKVFKETQSEIEQWFMQSGYNKNTK